MADDKGKTPAAPTVDVKATQEGAEAIKKFAAAERDFGNALRPNIAALDQWDLGLDKTTAQQEKLTDVIKEQIAAIKQHAREVGSLQSQFRDLGGAVTGYLGTLKGLISVTNVYEKMIHKVQAGQKNYMGSLQASTSSLGKASAESTRQIDAYKAAMNSANQTAIAYNLNMEEMKQQFDGLHTRLVSVTSAYENQSEIFDKVSKSAVQFSRFMGVDFAEAQDLITSRLENSTKSLHEVRVEMMAVAKEADKYTDKLKGMGNEAMKAGTVTRQGFLKVLREIEQMFKGGMYTAAEGFAKTTSSILVKAKEMGFTPSEAQNMAGSFGKVFGDMAKFDNIFGARVAQKLGDVIKDIGSIQDENLRKRLAPYVDRAKSGTLNVVDLKGIADAAKGSSEGMRLLLQTFRTSGMAPDVMRSVLGDAMGPGQQHIADALARLLQEGKMEEAFELIGAGDKKAAEEKEKELDLWSSSFEEFNKQAHASTKLEYQMAMKIKELTDRVKAFFEKFPITMMGIMAGAQLAGGLLGARMAGTAAARAAGAAGMAGGAPVAAGGAAAAGGVGALGMIAGGATAAYGGYKAGQWLDKDAYKRYGLDSDSNRRRFGSNAGISDVAGNWMANKWKGGAGFASNLGYALSGGKKSVDKGYSEEGMEMLKNVTRIRGVMTESHIKEYKQNEKQIEWARKNWDKLDEGQRTSANQREEQQKDLKHFIEQSTSSDKDKKKARDEQADRGTKSLLASLGKVGGSDKNFAESIRGAVGEAGAFGQGMGGDVAAQVKKIMESNVAKGWISGGRKKEDVQKILEKELFMKQYGEVMSDADAAKPEAERNRLAMESLAKRSRAGEITGSAETLAIGQSLIEQHRQNQATALDINVRQEGGTDSSRPQKVLPGANGQTEITGAVKFTLDFLGTPQWMAGQMAADNPKKR